MAEFFKTKNTNESSMRLAMKIIKGEENYFCGNYYYGGN